MSDWNADELDAIGNAVELEIAPARADGSFRTALPIWVVRVADDLYVRSIRGDAGGWYRQARRTGRGRISAGGVDREVTLTEPADDVTEAIDDAYRAKYGRYGDTYIGPMTAPAAVATTLRLQPVDWTT